MGFLHDKLIKARQILEGCNYELSPEVYNRKLDWEQQISKHIDNDQFEGIIDIRDMHVYMEVEDYDASTGSVRNVNAKINMAYAFNGSVWFEDELGNNLEIDDVDEKTYATLCDVIVNKVQGMCIGYNLNKK